MAGHGEPDEEPDVHAGVVPEKSAFAAGIFGGESLGQHHVDAGDIETAAGKEQGKTDVEQCERTGRDTGAPDHLQRHAPHEQVPVRQETSAQVTPEEVQAIVESAKYAHQRSGYFHRELQMLRRVENQGRVKNGEPKRREDLNKEQHSRSRNCGEPVFERIHPVAIWTATPNNVKAALGSACASRAGFGVSPRRTFLPNQLLLGQQFQEFTWREDSGAMKFFEHQ